MGSKLTEMQLKVIGDLFRGMDEGEIIEKYGLRKSVFDRWRQREDFKDEIARRVQAAHTQSKLIVANYAPLAAMRLVQLMESEKEETSRKACLDIISIPAATGEGDCEAKKERDEEEMSLDKETEEEIIKVLAESRVKRD